MTAGAYVGETTKQRIAEGYTGGLEIPVIAVDVKLTADQVTEILGELGISLRQPKPAPDISKIVQAYDDGHSIRQIARQMGKGYGTIHRILRENTTLRPRGAPSSLRHKGTP